MMRRFDSRGRLAVSPSAMGMEFDMFVMSSAQPFRLLGDVAVVDIRGPLAHHGGLWQSYDQIHDAVAAACSSSASTIVLKLDSPGGDEAGCFDCARELRAMARGAGKPMVAFVDGQACSAGYALACAADRIVMPDSARVGSVGVLYAVVDQTALDQAMGLQFTMLASGNRKLDGNPHVPLSDMTRAELQGEVDTAARVFFGLVEEMRGIEAPIVEAMQARIFLGRDAVDVGLADEVSTFDQLIASLSTGALAMDFKEAIAALHAAAEGEDEEQAAKAKRALAAMDGPMGDGDEEKPEPESFITHEGDKWVVHSEDGKVLGEHDTEEDAQKQLDAVEAEKHDAMAADAADGDPDADGDNDESAEGDTDNDKGKPADTEKNLAASVQQLSAEVKQLKSQRRAEQRRKLFASRPDLAPELKKALAKESPAKIKAILDALPRSSAHPAAAAKAGVAPTRGAGQGNGVGTGEMTRRSDSADILDRKFGLTTSKRGVFNQGRNQYFGFAPKNTQKA